MKFSRILLAIILLISIYFGYYWYAIKQREKLVLQSIPPIIDVYQSFDTTYVVPLTQSSDATENDKNILQNVHAQFENLKQQSGRPQIASLMEMQKTSFTLFNASGSTLYNNAQFALWRNESSQLGKVFPKLVDYNIQATIFNAFFNKPLINILGWVLGIDIYPVIDVNGSIYHAVVRI